MLPLAISCLLLLSSSSATPLKMNGKGKEGKGKEGKGKEESWPEPEPGLYGIQAYNEHNEPGKYEHAEGKTEIMGYWEMLQQYRLENLPESVNIYINKTLTDGRDLVYDLYDDIKGEVLDGSNSQVDAVTELMNEFIGKIMEIQDSAIAVISQSEVLSDEEIQARNDKAGLDQLRERFDDMEGEVMKEMEEDEDLPEGVEQIIQGCLSYIRLMMASFADKETEFWSKLKQLELEFWQLESASADTTDKLREKITDIFQTIGKVDLNNIGSGGDEPRGS